MFIKKATIQNFRLFKNDEVFEVQDLNVPDGTEGGGLTVFVGENGCGKTSLLESFAMPLLSYKADSFSLGDFFDPGKETIIQVFSGEDFNFSGTMPNTTYKAQGFSFEARKRARDNRNYLSSIIVSDQKYIKANGQDKPKEDSPDLRVSVNNPFKGLRFNENDILFLDKNRTFQVRSGTYNKTRFDRLMEDFDFQYLKQASNPLDLGEKLQDVSSNIENNFLKNTIAKFQEISGENISLAFIDNWTPHKNAFFGIEKDNKQHISLDSLGSGYEMIFSLLYSFYLSKQSNKQLIVFIDEPELHLHPKLQEDFVKVLLEFSKTAQIFLTTHSPLFVKQVLYTEKAQVHILKKETDKVVIAKIEERVLPYISANEINFVAFGLPTEEYHNELFEELQTIETNAGRISSSIKDFDINFFQNSKHEAPIYPYFTTPNQVSIHTHLRTQIHHRGTSGKADISEIKQSIEKMRSFF